MNHRNSQSKITVKDIKVYGIPNHIDSVEASLCTIAIKEAVKSLVDNTGLNLVKILVTTQSPEDLKPPKNNEFSQRDELTLEERASQYNSKLPLYNFNFLVIPDSVKEELSAALTLIKSKQKIFDEWNLRLIEPFPRTVLNFHGEPGTGKSLAAHAIADYLGCQILAASYAQIESKFHGDGPKNVEALFLAAERDKAVLFIDEADSLLSKRLTNVTQGSEQAINSMRSQLLICLERFQGVVIFATNLFENYDKAFESRIRSIKFSLPDENTRFRLWEKHLPKELPLENVFIEELAKLEDISGRDIKNAVIDAASRAVIFSRSTITQSDLLISIERIKYNRISNKHESSNNSEIIKRQIAEQVQKKLLVNETVVKTNELDPMTDSEANKNV
jgi:SpoVK/Ycf46/Vps4 family AAA+-type ATPase